MAYWQLIPLKNRRLCSIIVRPGSAAMNDGSATPHPEVYIYPTVAYVCMQKAPGANVGSVSSGTRLLPLIESPLHVRSAYSINLSTM